MTERALDCADIRRGFVEGRPLTGAGLEAHLRSCPQCSVLFEDDAALGRALAGASPLPSEVSALLPLVTRELEQEVGLRARLRAWPTRFRIAALLAFGALLMGVHLVWWRRPDFASYSGPIFALVVALLLVGAYLGAVRLTRGVTLPRAAGAARWLPPVLLFLPAMTAFLSAAGGHPEAGQDDWASPVGCFGWGAALTAPLVGLVWLFDRRDYLTSSALVLTGALAGLMGNLLLQAHCGSSHWGHLLLGHATIGAAWAAFLALGSRVARHL